MPLSSVDRQAFKTLVGVIKHDYYVAQRSAYSPECKHCQILDRVQECIAIRDKK